MALKPLNPSITLRLLEGHKNILGPIAQAQNEFYSKQVCSECGSKAVQKTQDPRKIFREGDLVANWLLSCKDCGAVFNPHTGLLIVMGNPAAAMVPTATLLSGPDD